MVILSELQKLCHQQSQAAGFDSTKRNVGEGLMLMVSELAEGLEEYRNGHDLAQVYYNADGKPEGYPVELADCLIRILDEVEGKGIRNFEDIVMEKLAYNRTRAFRHGNKLA